MTAGQRLIEQGRQQGMQEFLLRQLRHRFGNAVNAHVEQRIATASCEDIEAWSTRVLSAATLAELFVDGPGDRAMEPDGRCCSTSGDGRACYRPR
jgi:hypothetical protein